jgi:transcriptional regulator with XRE-family HTH domain
MTVEPGRCYSLTDLGAAVRAARAAAGHSQAEGAARASALGDRVDRAHVSHAERGNRLYVKALRALVAAYLTDAEGRPLRLAEDPSFGVELGTGA